MAWTTPGTATAGEVLTAAFWNQNVRDNLNAVYTDIKRIGYVQRTTNYTASSSSFAGAADVFASNISFTADGTSTYRIELFVAELTNEAATRALRVGLNLNGTQTGRSVLAYSATAAISVSGRVERYLIPAAGATTVNFRFYHDTAQTNAIAGDGTGSNVFPMWMAVYGPIIS